MEKAAVGILMYQERNVVLSHKDLVHIVHCQKKKISIDIYSTLEVCEIAMCGIWERLI